MKFKLIEGNDFPIKNPKKGSPMGWVQGTKKKDPREKTNQGDPEKGMQVFNHNMTHNTGESGGESAGEGGGGGE